MPKAQEATEARSNLAGHNDLLRLVADLDDSKALEILALGPTVAEAEEAALWAAGNGDILAQAGHPLTGIAAQIFEILTADEEEPPPAH